MPVMGDHVKQNKWGGPAKSRPMVFAVLSRSNLPAPQVCRLDLAGLRVTPAASLKRVMVHEDALGDHDYRARPSQPMTNGLLG